MEYAALLELCWGIHVSSGFATDISGNLLSCLKVVKHPFESQEGTWDCSRGTAGKSYLILLSGGKAWFFSSSSGKLGVLLKL